MEGTEIIALRSARARGAKACAAQTRVAVRAVVRTENKMRVAIELDVDGDWAEQDVIDVVKMILEGRIDYARSAERAAMIGDGRTRVRRIRVLRAAPRRRRS